METEEVKMLTRDVKVVIKTRSGDRIHGTLNLMADIKEFNRLSDFFIDGANPFVAIYKVTEINGEIPISDFFVLNRNDISWVVPDEGELRGL